MANTGDRFFNPATRTWVTFVTVPAQGGILTTEWLVPQGETLPSAQHYHFLEAPGEGAIAETFEVLSGVAAWSIADEAFRATAPTRIDIPFNTIHAHPRNAGDDVLRVRQVSAGRNAAVLTPVEHYFETLIALSQEGKADATGKIANRLQAALTLHAFLLDPTYLPRLPRLIQKLLFGALAGLAQLLGYTAFHWPQGTLSEEDNRLP